MNIDPGAYTVLCYGDSNTYGARPDEDGRFPADQRWTGRLQALLGDRYAVIEEGLNGRTTDLDYADRPGRNGRAYLGPCLASHNPLDAVVLMLGSNDVKTEFGRSAADVAGALGGLLDDIAEYAVDRAGRTPTIVLVSPVEMDDTRPLYAEWTATEFDAASVAASRGFAGAIGRLAEDRGVVFVAASSAAEPGDDGLHLGGESHRRLGELLARTIAELFA